jgi:hypothetical protein
MESIGKAKKTQAKKMLYVGGAIWEGQDIQGVELTPDVIRCANIFQSLAQKYEVESIDLGNVCAIDHKPTAENAEQSAHNIRNLQLLDDLL